MNDATYRFALVAFFLCVAVLSALLVPWLGYLFGPELSVYDVGAPQLRSFA